MTKEELAKSLDGEEYRYFRIDKKRSNEIASDGLVVAFGQSDDLLEFRGAIYDEVGAYGGTEVKLSDGGMLLNNECSSDDCPYFEELVSTSKNYVKAHWHRDGYSWVIETNLPHSTFEIVEDGEKYCRGVVFELLKSKSSIL